MAYPSLEYTGYLDFWFAHLPLVERVAAFSALGIHALDIWAWRFKPMDELADACRQHHAYLNSTFDPTPGNLVDSEEHERCLDAWAESLEMAERCGVRHLFAFSNQIDVDANGSRGEWTARLNRDIPPGEQYANLIDGLHKVMALVEKTSITVWFEALNTHHIHGGVFIHSHAQAADLVQRVNHPRLRMAFDVYHQQRTAGNLIHGLHAHAGLYDTVHIADVPTRQEPGTGEVNFDSIAHTLRELNFTGKIGLEFHPSKDEADVFAQIKRTFGIV